METETVENTNPDVDAEGDAEVQTEAYEKVTAGTSYTRGDEEGKVEASVNLFVGATIDEAIEAYGEAEVYERYRRGLTKDCGNAIRSLENRLLDDPNVAIEDIPGIVEDELKDWRPDVTRRRVKKSKKESLMENFDELSPEEQMEAIEALKARAAAALSDEEG